MEGFMQPLDVGPLSLANFGLTYTLTPTYPCPLLDLPLIYHQTTPDIWDDCAVSSINAGGEETQAGGLALTQN